MPQRPNILFVMTDEQRFPPSYESAELAEFRRTQLPAQTALFHGGVTCHRHYAGSVACAPSRATIMTGHYPVLHGVRATDGAAKGARDADVFWLDPDTVPTMGDYFRAGGYRTFYRGKWHVSHADLVTSDSHEALASNDVEGKVIPKIASLYAKAQRLRPFGFDGWIGPEPHGMAQSNTGLVRDPLTCDQLIELFDQLDASDDDQPWFTVASFLNPHDIALSGLLWRSFGYPTDDGTVPKIPTAPTERESLRTKPDCQQDFVDKYSKIFINQPQTPAYRRFYYWLHKLVDEQIGRLMARLQGSRFADNTIVVFTSDHGEMLGAHGGMHQKWYCAYDETWRVPLSFTGPGLPAGATLDTPSSHVDLLPTMLGLAGLDAEQLRRTLAETHTEAQPLVGRDLSGALQGGSAPDDPIYMMTEDEISEGLSQTTAILGRDYEAVEEPAKVEAVVTRLEAGGPLYKFARYYENSQVGGGDQQRWRRGKQEFELYDLDADPTETENLAHRTLLRPKRKALIEQLTAVLESTRTEKAVRPHHAGLSQ